MDIDRISSLPEHIRDRIVSFLPMVDAIRASTLSRNWRSVYSSLSNLEINYRQFGGVYDRRGAINCFLLHHDKSDINVFKLSVNVDDTVGAHNHVNGWISFAINHNVKELYIEFFDRLERPMYLPCCLFTCSSLMELTMVGITLALPTVISLPVLKRMSLTGIYMEEYDLAENIFPNCPLLEFLSITDVKVRQINVCAPNLQQISFYGSTPPNITLETLTSLRNVEFSFSEIDQVDFDDHASKIWMGLQNVGKLHLKNKLYVEYLSRVPDLKACLSTSYCSLKDLLLHISSTNRHIQALTMLLKGCPYLETLSILVVKQTTSTDSSSIERDTQLQDLSTAYTMKHLATVKFYSFEGSEIELYLVRYFLENGKVLQKIYTIYADEMIKNIAARWRISEELLKFTRASPRAKIVSS